MSLYLSQNTSENMAALSSIVLFELEPYLRHHSNTTVSFTKIFGKKIKIS